MRRIVHRSRRSVTVVHPLHDDQSKSIKKEQRSPEVDFANTFRPIHYCSRLCGLMTFSIVCGSDGEVLNPRVSLLDGVWFGIMLCIHTVMVLLFYRYVCISSTNVVSPSLSVGVNIIILLPEIIGGVVSTLNLCNRFKIVRILNTFKVFDTKVKLHT